MKSILNLHYASDRLSSIKKKKKHYFILYNVIIPR